MDISPKISIFSICTQLPVLFILAGIICVNAVPVFNSSSAATTNLTQVEEEFSEGLRYMTHYGYIKTADSIDTYLDLIDRIKEVQRMLYVNQTGVLDHQTVTAMRRPRCGVKDIFEDDHSITRNRTRNRRYLIYWNKWKKSILTYNIENYPSRGRYRLTRAQVDDAVHRATEAFSKATRLRFKKVTGYADIRIRFESYDHGDGFPLDGEHGTIAHAFVPNGRYGDLDGDIHFDNSEEFTLKGDEGYNFYQTVLHELGHSLGLEHSWDYDAVMYPAYHGYYQDYQLNLDDIRGIQLLYGQKEKNIRLKVSRPNAYCNIPYDAAGMVDGQLYVFKDRRFWRVKGATRMTGKSGVPIKRRFKGLPSKIDAVYQTPFNRHIYIFKGNKYWVYKRNTLLDSSYPRSITDFGLPDDMTHIDAVFIMARYNTTYFFKGHWVWRYNEYDQTMEEGYPYLVAEIFPGIPTPVSAAFDYTDYNTYFVVKKKYFLYSNKYRNAEPGYPRYFGQDWLKC